MNETILLCDDEIHILNASKFKFQRAGYQVLTAADGEEAWPLIERESPHLVVTDYQMPRLNGLQLIQRMRDHEHSRRIPVLMLTAKGFEMSHSEMCRQYHISQIVHKPFSPRVLLKTVEELLAARRQQLNDTVDLADTEEFLPSEESRRQLFGQEQ
jgi:two-component system, OmpR family, alkaline phosphatase synthesis response regulator PhoP